MFCGLTSREFDGELEEAELVGRVWGSYDECPNMANVDVAAGNCESCMKRLAVVVIQGSRILLLTEIGTPLNLT